MRHLLSHAEHHSLMTLAGVFMSIFPSWFILCYYSTQNCIQFTVLEVGSPRLRAASGEGLHAAL